MAWSGVGGGVECLRSCRTALRVLLHQRCNGTGTLPLGICDHPFKVHVYILNFTSTSIQYLTHASVAISPATFSSWRSTRTDLSSNLPLVIARTPTYDRHTTNADVPTFQPDCCCAGPWVGDGVTAIGSCGRAKEAVLAALPMDTRIMCVRGISGFTVVRVCYVGIWAPGEGYLRARFCYWLWEICAAYEKSRAINSDSIIRFGFRGFRL